MRKIGIAALAALALGVPAAAHAQDGAALDCIITTTTPEMQAGVAAAMTSEGTTPEEDALFEELRDLSDVCAIRAGLSGSQANAYFAYARARMTRTWVRVELARYSLNADVIDRVFDFGPGRANPDLSVGMSEAQGNAVVRGFRAENVNVDKVPDYAWYLVGTYAAAASSYWTERAKLGL